MRSDLAAWTRHESVPLLGELKKIHSGERFQKDAVSVSEFTTWFRLDKRPIRIEIYVQFQKYPDLCGRGFMLSSIGFKTGVVIANNPQKSRLIMKSMFQE